ncbi:MAG: ABC transporter permease [Dehalococcoidales bacterium]|nr:ABC transporter permease [Dehalococcoidales bacterium]
MVAYIIRRLLQLIPVVLLASVLVFLLLRLVPGDPAETVAGPDATPDVIEAVRHKMGLDQPLPVQYGIWLGDVVRGDLGESYISKMPVSELIGYAFPATLQLTLAALFLAVCISIPFGVIAAVKQASKFDLMVQGYTALGLGVPNFWLGILLILLFALVLGWLPPGGRIDPMQNPGMALRTLLLPAVTLAVHMSAVFTRFVRSAMLEVLHEDYVRTARAKGLEERAVVLGHALRSALVPVVTVVGLQFGRLLGGAVVVESVFAWPGLGRLMIQAVEQRDYTVVQASLLWLVLVFVLINLLTDITYAYLDPRIRLSRGGG